MRGAVTREEVEEMILARVDALKTTNTAFRRLRGESAGWDRWWTESVLDVGDERALMPEHLQGFDPFTSFVNGFAGTTNLILTLFLCNPNTSYSKEEVYAQLNQKLEKIGLGEFLISKGYEFSNTIDAKGGLKLGRNTVFRLIDNATTTFSLLEECRASPGHFQLNQGNPMCLNLRGMRDFAKESPLYQEFLVWSKKRCVEYNSRSTHYESLTDCVSEYVGDLKQYSKQTSKNFISKNRRLVEFSETSNLKWSTLQKKWNDELRTQLIMDNQHKTVLDICNRLGINLLGESKTKKDMANRIVSKTKSM
jgi:hypothetical protein